MDITLNHTAIFPRGRRAQDVGGQQMAETSLIVVGAGLLGGGGWAFIQHLIGLRRQTNRDETDDIHKFLEILKTDNADLRERMDLQEAKSEKQAKEIEAQSKQIAVLFTEKVTLESRIAFLVDQIAEREATIQKLSERDILSQTVIDDLKLQVAHKIADLDSMRRRLDFLKTKFPDAVTLYQIDGMVFGK